MKRTIAIILALCMMFALCACGQKADAPASEPAAAPANAPTAAPAEETATDILEAKPIPEGARVLQLGHNDPASPDNAYQILAVKFADYMLENSNGTIGVEIYPNSALGAERERIEGLGLGTLDLSISANQYISGFIDDFKVYDLPYIYGLNNVDGAIAAFTDPEIIGPMKDKLRDEFGAVLLASGSLGFRHVINDAKQIKTVDDISGMKIRVPEVPSLVKTFEAWGSNPTAVAWAECYPVVQQKTVDGLEIPLGSIVSSHFDDICRYVTLTYHGYQVLHILASGPVWDSLTPEEQGWFQDAAERAAKDQLAALEEIDARLLEGIKAKGVIVDEMENPDAWIEAVQPVYEDFAQIIGWDLINKVKEVAAAAS